MSCPRYNKYIPINFLIIKISKEMRGRKKRISSLHGKAEVGDIAQILTACIESTGSEFYHRMAGRKKAKDADHSAQY
jgi:hypothetical protein